MPGKLRSGGRVGDGLASALNTLRAKRLSRSLASLPALVLAGALCVSLAAPALADFESAVAAYERGAYQEAQAKFEDAVEAGDERAVPYLERIRQRLTDDEPTDGSLTSTISEMVTSIFDGPDSTSDDSESQSATGNTVLTAAGPSAGGVAGKTGADWELWSPFDQGAGLASPPPPASDVVTPQHESVWSAIFHLPGDATVIGLQHVAQFLEADNFNRELQFISRHSDKITLSILAGFWWLVIIKGMVGLGIAIGRFMRAVTTRTENQRYG